MSSGWTTARLGDICSRLTDGSHAPPKGCVVGRPMLSARNIMGRKITFDEARLLAPHDFDVEDRRTAITPGDVLMTIVGTIGRTAVVPVGAEPFTLQRSVSVIRSYACEPRFLAYALEAPVIHGSLIEMASGTAQKGVYLKALAGIEIPVAPLQEQQRIADKLDAILVRVDACRLRLNELPKLLVRLRQSVLAAAMSGRLTADVRAVSDAGAPSALPTAWAVCSIKEAGKIQLGRQRSPKFHLGDNMRPYLRVQNVFEDRIELSDVMSMDFPGEDFERYQLHAGDILLNEGQSPQFLGRPAMYRGELPGACFTNTLIRFQPFDHVDGEFALLVFRHQMHSGRYVSEGTITTNIAHLGAGRFGNVEFPVPPLAEQKLIVTRAKALFALADRLEARVQAVNAAMDRLTPALLAKAFRGELVPQDPNDEPAAVMLARLRAEPPPGTKAAPTRRRRAAATTGTGND